ncbi:MAG TPA: ABC transporter substrate-binding protein [Gaiellaceae bacterium]|jgi:trehalose/maltose transport system substrate-binding protein|nr:ABC transporter substrate-binding protein [Gaiellaceae bacterium]
MKGNRRRGLTLATILAAALALVVGLNAASAGTAHAKKATATKAMKAPKVPNAKAIRAKYKGQTITFVGDSVGGGHQRDMALSKQFTKDTGIKVKVVPHPAASDASYSQLARAFSTHSSSIDVAMVDVVWPGSFAPFLVNLKPALGKQAKIHAAGIVKNDTVGGKLVAMPWFGDYGMLYYRTDLLKKYGYSKPPTTWPQLFAMAKKIQAGERASNPNFSGFVFQGNAYEGLTCNALEWLASSGGGTFIDSKGKVTINNKNARNILNLFRSQIGVSTPRGVTTYQEGETHTAFIDGNAAFMRNWPYAYSLAQAKDSKVKGKFAVAPLPHGTRGHSVATVGGWQLAVSKYSKHKGAAIEFVRYMTSMPVEKFDTITNSNVPTIPALAKDKAFVKKYAPYLSPATANVPRATRPSSVLGTKYNEGSKDIYQAVSRILNGTPAQDVLPGLQSQLQALVK